MGDLSLFLTLTFFWSIIYTFTLLASACVGLLHFLKAGYWGIFCHALLLCSDHASCCCHSTNRKNQRMQRPYSCHLAGAAACTWAGTRCHSSRVTTYHDGGRWRKDRSSSCSSRAGLCHCVSAFNTPAQPSRPCVWRGVESSSHTHASRRNLPPLLPLWRTRGEAKLGRLKKQNETKRGRRG